MENRHLSEEQKRTIEESVRNILAALGDSVAYLPKTKVTGLSKVARIADMVCKRLQLQERITSDIAQIMQLVLGTEDVLVHIEGEHSCMTARGIRKPGTVTTTTVSCGAFKTDAALRTEVFSQL